MSNETSDMPGPTQPTEHHAWLQNLVGEWRTASVMSMGPDQPEANSTGTESVRSLGGLWAMAHGKGDMGENGTMEYFMTLGYDVSFNEYRGCWFADVSSHLWKYNGELSADGRTMTLTCEGPDMMSDTGGTAWYRDVHEIIDADNRTMTSFGQMPGGEWVQFQKTTFVRI